MHLPAVCFSFLARKRSSQSSFFEMSSGEGEAFSSKKHVTWVCELLVRPFIFTLSFSGAFKGDDFLFFGGDSGRQIQETHLQPPPDFQNRFVFLHLPWIFLGVLEGTSKVKRPWLCEERIQHVAAMPDPLPLWAQKSPIWSRFCLKGQVDFLFFLFFLKVLECFCYSFLTCFGYFLMGFALPNWPSGRFLWCLALYIHTKGRILL